MAINLEDIKNMKLPLHMVISIVVFTIGTISFIDGRYAHREEVQELRKDLEEQQDQMNAYFTKIIERLDERLRAQEK